MEDGDWRGESIGVAAAVEGEERDDPAAVRRRASFWGMAVDAIVCVLYEFTRITRLR